MSQVGSVIEERGKKRIQILRENLILLAELRLGYLREISLASVLSSRPKTPGVTGNLFDHHEESVALSKMDIVKTKLASLNKVMDFLEEDIRKLS
jgi:hypothetical protein